MKSLEESKEGHTQLMTAAHIHKKVKACTDLPTLQSSMERLIWRYLQLEEELLQGLLKIEEYPSLTP